MVSPYIHLAKREEEQGRADHVDDGKVALVIGQECGAKVMVTGTWVDM